MSGEPKGQVTYLSSLFPIEETGKAAQRVKAAIVKKQNEIDQLNTFLNDNNNLVKLILKLPDELKHEIMVPFGKAAFFPGQLVHTNEFMVLMGESYYAEQTVKKTADILSRRRMSLQYSMESLRANLKDLEMEASFFDSTLLEAADGLVEIREDPVGIETRSESLPGKKKKSIEDVEYASMLSVLDELEKEEQLAETLNRGAQEEVNAIERNESDANEQLGAQHCTRISEHTESKAQSFLPQPAAAFTGSVIERTHNLIAPRDQKHPTSQASRPASRFKMQRK